MAINTLSGVTGTQQQQNITNADSKLLAVIESIVTGTNSSDVANVSIASQLQSQTNELNQLAGNLAQASSLTQVADGGVSQIGNVLGQLQSLSQQAESPIANSDTLDQLNQQFQQLVNQVDQLATGTTFNGQSLLDGSLSGNNALSIDNILSPGSDNNNDGTTLSISSLTSNSLFGSQGINISNPNNAAQALTSINNAINQVTGTQSNIGAFQQILNFASANIETAVINQQAAQSSLTDTDIASASTSSTLAQIQQNAAIAVAAQGNRLTPTILQLIG